MPLGMSFTKVTDQSVNITEAYDEFMLKFFVALAVVIVVSLVSLGFRVGLVVAMAVPLTLAGVFVIMLVTGRDFDRITLGALILSLGLLVDDAIIIIETIVVKMEEGRDRVSAATYAWGHTAAPMLAGTLVTIIGLMPVGFAKSTAGEYAGNIFWVVAFALITSWFVAVIFTPYLGVLMIPKIKPVEGGHAAIYDTPRYRRLRSLVVWTVDNRFKVAAGRGRGDGDRRPDDGRDQEAVLPDLRPPRGAGRGADARRPEHRVDQPGGDQGRNLAAPAARGQDRHQLYRPRGAAVLPGHFAGASRPVLRQDHRADPRPEGARRPQAAPAPVRGQRRRCRAPRSARPRSCSARPLPSPSPSASWAPTPPACARSPSRFAP
jgi:hypothetical protein